MTEPALPPPEAPRASRASRILIAPIRGYQRWISPGLPPTCRFYPSCSAYAVEAIQVHGALRGIWLTTRRLLKCGPWHRGGTDPVPPRVGRGGRRRGGAPGVDPTPEHSDRDDSDRDQNSQQDSAAEGQAHPLPSPTNHPANPLADQTALDPPPSGATPQVPTDGSPDPLAPARRQETNA